MYEQITQFTKMLRTLSRLLDKAQEHAEANKVEPEILLNARLAPDMLPLTSQVQWACEMARLVASVLSGKEVPVFDNTEKTIPELKALIQTTIAYVMSMKEADFAGWEERIVAPPGWSGAFLGKDYLHQHGVPNFYFHMVTAYDILRHKGVRIGKMDYIGQLPFLR
ncbi:DUF1993 domain-containing protein [Falsirhodobacter halotolerans]|uniref:DUF1993 domain-containing protein n=1 Tax=Falsirhodobacter halotolerans TaxID=1146892 RepID=UPI001FD10446|nr:DUF1993 domain-containing protein [Falsirhodobacter halotolerans]MCJ8140117.1 DUF1993 domain-containing protein [Falsirhodobacter halotolerans]